MSTVPSSGFRVPGSLAVENSPLGRIYVWGTAPVFYTTSDFDGYLTDYTVPLVLSFIQSRFAINAALWSCHQVHGVHAAHATRNSELGTRNHWTECDTCDALWSDASGVALAIKVADCLPVTLIDPKHRVIANIHSGWRGAAQRITAVTLDRLTNESSFTPADSQAYLGPSIRQCCFEVGDEVVQQFAGGEGYTDRTRGPRAYLDLVTLTVDLLVSAGLSRENVFDSGLCTRCNGSLFHSYRRNGAGSGRNLAIVAH